MHSSRCLDCQRSLLADQVRVKIRFIYCWARSAGIHAPCSCFSLLSPLPMTLGMFLVFLISRTFRQIYISLLSFANSCSNDRLIRIPYAILYFANCTKRLQPPGHAWFRGCTFLCVRSAFPSILTHQFICQLSGGTVMPLISWNVQEHGLFWGIWCPARYQVKLDGRR